MLRKCAVEHESENSQLKATATESSETITTLQRTVDAGIEDYELLQVGNNSVLDEHNDIEIALIKDLAGLHALYVLNV
jgi:hypothetical protein